MSPEAASIELPASQGLPRLAIQLRWLIGVRLAVVTSIAILLVLLQLLTIEIESGDLGSGVVIGEITADPSLDAPRGTLEQLDWGFVTGLIGLTYGASLFYLLFLRVLDRHPVLHAHLQFLGDLVLISGLIYYFGGAGSPFSVLFLIVISVASALLRRRAAIYVATEAFALYILTLSGLFFGWLPPPDSPFVQVDLSSSRLQYNLMAHLLGFYGVAILSAYLAQTVTRTERALEQRIEEIADLEVAHHDILQSIPSGLLTTDPEGRITSLNQVGARVLGVDPGAVRGQPFEMTGLPAFHPGDTVRRSQILVRQARGEIPVGYSVTPLTDSHGTDKGNIVVFQDLTEWHALQQELRFKDRMAAVGELAAGIAHEIGNPLASISGSAQMLADIVETDPQRLRLLKIVQKESQRLDRTVKNFLRFARPRDWSGQTVDIAALLRESFELLHNNPELVPGHRLELELDPPRVEVVIDPDQVSQIFWNLTRNALRAMPDGGTLLVKGEHRATVYRFTVADEGRGMSPEEQERLFHPYQTFFDGGTGIGLAIVYRLVEAHQGTIWVESELGRGSAFVVELPVAGPRVASNAREEEVWWQSS